MNKRTRQQAIALIEEKVIRLPECGCWIWPDNDIRILDKSESSAYRMVYEIFYGPLVADDEITHKCHLECCLNPKHLSLDRSNPHYPSTVMKDKLLFDTLLRMKLDGRSVQLKV